MQIKWLFDHRRANDGGHVFIISVDGVHCPINEPRKKPSAKWYSHKFNKPGLAYEIAVSVYSSKVVWVRGPFPAGTGDLSIFKRLVKGLKYKMPNGTKAIADRAYTSESVCATRNDEFDDPRVRKFKRRARARHENFNARIKVYNALTIPFRHGVEKHGAVFDVACILVQYDMDNGHPLFEV
jgi:DDE superfamily endonuclease